MAEYLIAHIRKIQTEVAGCLDACFVINCEANMAYAASSIEYIFNKIQVDFDYYIMCEDSRKAAASSSKINMTRAIIVAAGSRTDNRTKAEWVQAMTRLLRDDRIHFHKDFTSAQTLPMAPYGYQDLRTALIRQFGEYTSTTTPPKVGSERTKYGTTVYCGKDQDDLITACMMGPWTLDRLRTSQLTPRRLLA